MTALFACALAGCKGGSEKDPLDGLAQDGQPAECAPGMEDALAAKISDSVRKIRIAQSNADLKLMTDNGRTLDALARCSAFDRFCDADCAGQRASVQLFMAAALPLLSSKGSAPPAAPGGTERDQLAAATVGIQIAETALQKLPRQRGFGAAANATDSQGEGGFNQYVKAYAQLQSLRAELQMVAGDIYYRRVSTARSKAISFVVSEVLGDDPPDRGQGSDLGNALGYYEQAYWTLLDARTTMPAELGNSPLFGAELNQLNDLTQKIGERLASAREGKLYIGVDPSGFQGQVGAGLITLDELTQQLELQRKALAGVEGELDDTMGKWAAKSQELAQIGDQMAELQNSRAIDLAVHKMNEVRERAEARTAPIERAIQGVELAEDDFQLEAQIQEARLSLEVSKNQLRNDLRDLAAQNQEDVLDRAIEGTRLDLDVVGNAIDSTLADFNFDMQIAALKQQAMELAHSKENETQNLTALTAQARQLDADVSDRGSELDVLRLEIASLTLRRDEVVANQTRALQHQVEATRAELGFLDSQTGLIDQVCEARTQLSTLNDAELQKQATCFSGGSCGSGSLANIYNQLLAQKQRLHATSVSEATKVRDLLVARIRDAEAAAREATALMAARTLQTVAATAALVAANVIPVITATAGLPPSVGTTIDPVKLVEPALQGAKEIAALASERFQFGYQVDAELAQLRTQLEAARLQLEQANIESVISQLETQQALAELSVRLLDVQQQQVLSAGERRIHTVECKLDRGRNVGDLGRANAELKALEAQLGVQGGERGILDLQLQQQDARIAQVEAALRKLAAQKDELAVRVAQSQGTLRHLTGMETAVDAQLSTVGVYRSKVATLAARRDELQKQLMAHIEQVSLVRLQANEEQRKFILSAIESEEKVAFQKIEALKARLALNAKRKELMDALAQIDAEAKQALAGYRDEITKLLQDRPLPTVQQVIWDFEDLSSRLTRGAAELLDYKRSLLNSTNFYYNAYRYRYNLLGEFVGNAPIRDDTPYIWTAADATARIADCAELGTTPLCAASSLANNARGLSLNAATFIISANSPMFQELLRTRRTRFEFAPSGADARSGFVLWNALNMQETWDMRVIGFYLGFPDLVACHPTNTEIRHTGLGYQGESMVMRPPIAERPTIVSAGQSPEEVSDWMEAKVASWTQRTISVLQLERRLASGEEGIMPFLGYPLRGVYELISQNPTGCLEQARQMYLTVVFATRK